jgi:hypothetical protein
MNSKGCAMDILHILGFAGGATVYFVSLYYIGLNRWLVAEHTKMYAEFDSIKAEIAALKK